MATQVTGGKPKKARQVIRWVVCKVLFMNHIFGEKMKDSSTILCAYYIEIQILNNSWEDLYASKCLKTM